MEKNPFILIPHLLTRQKSMEEAKSVKSDLQRHCSNGEIRIARTREESLSIAREAEIVVCKGITNEFLEETNNLRWIQALSSGLDRFTTEKYGYEPPGLDRLKDLQIALTNICGVSAEPMAEQVFAYLLSLERSLHTATQNKTDPKWYDISPAGEINEKTFGIIGVGSVGTRAAEIGQAFGMEVIGVKRDTTDVPRVVDQIYSTQELDLFLPKCDYLLISCSLNAESREMINLDSLDALPSDAIVVNIARGEIIEQNALTRALENGIIRAAGLDVFHKEPLPERSPLRKHKNTILTPHYAGSSPQTGDRIGELFAKNYNLYIEEGIDSLKNRVV